MSEQRQEQEQSEQAPERPEREVDPAEGPAPRGNQEPDPERLERGLEDIDRAGAN